MIKLALCFSGDTRTYNNCFDSIKNNLLNKFDCDVFISSYEVNDEITNNILNLYKPKKYIFHKICYNIIYIYTLVYLIF